MSTILKCKKTANNWHREDVIAALHKAGWSLRQLSFQHGYSSGSSLKNALDKPWPKVERIIAEAIGVSAEEIWPERFVQRKNKIFANK